ncbi:cupin domain-containing protein [Methylobacterium amylolyticum]|uniref:cupin domain-containing protein n=1 Tax=Methylobacterium sp. NEAU 140 TaxID=3064945 RepID=UPI00351FB514
MIASVTSVDLRSAPIEPSWIHAGEPQARNATLSRSADGLASTLVWDCTAGTFEWHYDIDETIYFLEGSATISDGHGPAKTFTAGDVLFLPRGAVCHWHVESYVRKVAFCRRTQPKLVGLAMRAIGKAQRIFKRGSAPQATGLLGAA